METYKSFKVAAFSFFHNTFIQIMLLLLLGSEAMSLRRGSEIRSNPLIQGMLYNSFKLAAFPFFHNTFIQSMFLFYF